MHFNPRKHFSSSLAVLPQLSLDFYREDSTARDRPIFAFLIVDHCRVICAAAARTMHLPHQSKNPWNSGSRTQDSHPTNEHVPMEVEGIQNLIWQLSFDRFEGYANFCMFNRGKTSYDRTEK